MFNCLFGDVLDCLTHLCHLMDLFLCCGQEIKMAEQRYSESSSSSSVSTMGVELIKIIVAAMTMNLIMMCSSIKHKEAEEGDADGRQIEKVTNRNLNRYHLTTIFRTKSENDLF